MIKVLFALLLAMVAVSARADYPAIATGYSNGGSPYYTDPQRACNYGSTGNPDKPGTNPTATWNPSTRLCDWVFAPPRAADTSYVYITWACPYGGTLKQSGSLWNCLGANEPPKCPKDQVIGEYYQSNAGGPPSKNKFPYCSSGGCQVAVDYVGGCVGPSADGGIACLFRGKSTGTVCNGQTANAQDTNWGMGGAKPAGNLPRTNMPPTSGGTNGASGCPTGSVQGGVDSSGTPICIGRGADPENAPAPAPTVEKPPVTTTGSDGSTTTTQATSQTNGDGSTTTTTKTTVKAPDGTVSTSQKVETGNTPSGGAGKADTSSTPSSFCKDNPTLAACQNSTVSGACGEVQCTGDAIQCATLRATAAMECKARKESEELKASSHFTLGAAVAGGADPLASSLPTKANGSTVTMPSSLDQSGWLGAGAAFADVPFSVQGHNFTLPLSKATSYLIGLRYALMVVALLASFRMLSGVILRD